MSITVEDFLDLVKTKLRACGLTQIGWYNDNEGCLCIMGAVNAVTVDLLPHTGQDTYGIAITPGDEPTGLYRPGDDPAEDRYRIDVVDARASAIAALERAVHVRTDGRVDWVPDWNDHYAVDLDDVLALIDEAISR